MHIYITLLQIEQDMIGKTQIAIKFENIFIEWFFPPLHYTKTWSFLSGTLQKYSSSSEKKIEIFFQNRFFLCWNFLTNLPTLLLKNILNFGMTNSQWQLELDKLALQPPVAPGPQDIPNRSVDDYIALYVTENLGSWAY